MFMMHRTPTDTPHQKAANYCRVLAECFDAHAAGRFSPAWRWAECQHYLDDIRKLALQCGISGTPVPRPAEFHGGGWGE